MKTRLAECREQIDLKNSARTIEKFGSLQEELKDVMKWFKKFKEEQCASSKLFAYWEEYNTMVNLLLPFIQAERTGDWKLHLSAAAAMTPYFFAMDRHNYAQWLPVYLEDVYQIESKHPRVYVEFIRGNHIVCQSSHPYSQVSTDMALEQSINADSKGKRRHRRDFNEAPCSTTLVPDESQAGSYHIVTEEHVCSGNRRSYRCISQRVL